MTPSFSFRSILFIVYFMFFSATVAIAQNTNAVELPPKAEIRNVRFEGSGCATSMTTVLFSADQADLSVLFSDFVAEVGIGSKNPDKIAIQKECKVMADINVPDGWRFSFQYLDYRGYVLVPANAWAWEKFVAYVPSGPVLAMKNDVVKGPVNQDFQARQQVLPSNQVYSKCGVKVQTLVFLSQIAVGYYPNTKERLMTQVGLDSQDGSIRQNIGVLWSRCDQQRDPRNSR